MNTQAHSSLDVEDFDDTQIEDVAPAAEPKPLHVKLTESEYRTVSLFPDPPQANGSKLAQALARAAAKRAADAEHKASYATHLDEVLYGQDLDSRADILNEADAIVAAAENGKGQAQVRMVIRTAISDREEMVRKAEEFFGGRYVAMTDHKNLEQLMEGVCNDSAVLAEAVRLVCAAAGTVRVDELIPKTSADGRTVLVRRFVDVGDEESGQDPEVTPKYMLTAALKAAVRFENLRTEATRQAEAARLAQIENERLRKQLDETSAKLNAMQSHYSALCRAEQERGEEATFAPPIVRVTDGKHWLKLRAGMQSSLSWAYTVTEDMAQAVVFDSVEQAGAILNQISMTTHRAIHLDILDNMRVVRTVTEDHGVSSGDVTPTHYPASIMLDTPATAQKGSKPSRTTGGAGVRSYDVSVHADDDARPAAPVKPTKPVKKAPMPSAVAKPVKALAKPIRVSDLADAVTGTPRPAKPTKRPPLPKRPVKASAAPAKPVKASVVNVMNPADRKRAALALSRKRAQGK